MIWRYNKRKQKRESGISEKIENRKSEKAISEEKDIIQIIAKRGNVARDEIQ